MTKGKYKLINIRPETKKLIRETSKALKIKGIDMAKVDIVHIAVNNYLVEVSSGRP